MRDDYGWLQDQVIVLTRGGSGIGRAIIERYAEEGANVVVLDVDKAKRSEVDRAFYDSALAVSGNVAVLATTSVQ